MPWRNASLWIGWSWSDGDQLPDGDVRSDQELRCRAQMQNRQIDEMSTYKPEALWLWLLIPDEFQTRSVAARRRRGEAKAEVGWTSGPQTSKGKGTLSGRSAV
jgi:hypothetical protein